MAWRFQEENSEREGMWGKEKRKVNIETIKNKIRGSQNEGEIH